MALDSKPSLFFIFFFSQERVRVCMLEGPAVRSALGWENKEMKDLSLSPLSPRETDSL